MGKNKTNPFLAAFQEKLEKEFQGRLDCHIEIDMIAMLIAGNDLGFLGEKRADLFLERLVEVKMDIADELINDAKDDKQLEHTKAVLARRVKQILGAEGWDRCKTLFPLLKDYWED